MCGLVYARSFNKKPVNLLVYQQYQKQRSRGTMGFGFYNVDTKQLITTPKEHKIIKNLKRKPGSEILFHHRWPTSTDNVPNACHPFTTKNFFSKENGGSDTTYILAHNGIISSDKAKACKEEHEKLGIVYSSVQPDGKFNDSEALLWDFALLMENKKKKLDAGGSIAFICLAINEKKGNKLYFGRNYGSPLNIDYKEGENLYISSEGEGDIVPTDSLFCYYSKTGELTDTKLDIPSSYSHNYNSSSYSHSHRGVNTPPLATPGVEHTLTKQEDVMNIPEEVLNSAKDMVWDEKTQTLYLKDKNDEWQTWEDLAVEYAQKTEQDKELKDIETLERQEDNDNEESMKVVRGFRDDDYEEEVPLEDISPVLARSEGLKAQTDLASRQKDCRERSEAYLGSNIGNYQLAYIDVCKDLEWLQDQVNGMETSKDQDTELYKDLSYELSITQSICDGLIICPEWQDSASIATGYGSKNLSASIDRILDQRKQANFKNKYQQQLPLASNVSDSDKPITDENIQAFNLVKQQLIAKYVGSATGGKNGK